ncbi:MAG: acyl-CoA dehydrogenase family protein [Burkholderiales bacterium]|nr:acyl-CoA dehydrogenase family protein [Burkholderiales bacterium]
MNSALPVSHEGDEAYELLRNSARDFARGELDPARVRALRGKTPCFDRALWQRLAAMGWIGALIPENLGGSGLGYGQMACLVEVLGATLIPEPVVATAVLATEALKLAEGGSRDRLLGSIASGACIAALAHQESSGTAAETLQTVVSRFGSTLKLEGTKRYVYPGTGADGYIVSARGADGVGLYWVAAGAPGLDIHDEIRVDGTACARLTLRWDYSARTATVLLPPCPDSAESMGWRSTRASS